MGVGSRGEVGRAQIRRFTGASSTPARLRLARGIAAAACLLPGVVGMVQIATAATAPPTSPTRTYADLRAGVDTYLASSTVSAAGPGGDTKDANAALSLVTSRIGAAALLYPDRAKQLYTVSDQLAERQSQVDSARTKITTNSSSPVLSQPSDNFKESMNLLNTPPTGTSVSAGGSLAAIGGIGLFGGLGVSVWLARKTRRMVNPGLVGAIVLTGVVTIMGVQVLSSASISGASDDLASLRADAAASVEWEARTLLQGIDSTQALQARDEILRSSESRMSNISAAKPLWREFTGKAIKADQMTRSSIPTRQTAVTQRLADLRELSKGLATLDRADNNGMNRPNANVGYGLFALSLIAGASAWAGVGRRLAEYR
ncbi:hypothetical protein KEM60_00196 [Austwickia sp. TVS 96-490-7B]|nr:hypothetical protein [Austwickia sp. TVS 96-490-7B]